MVSKSEKIPVTLSDGNLLLYPAQGVRIGHPGGTTAVTTAGTSVGTSVDTTIGTSVGTTIGTSVETTIGTSVGTSVGGLHSRFNWLNLLL